MQHDHPPESEDGLHAELSDARTAPPDTRHSTVVRRSPWETRPNRRQRARRLAGIATIGLLAVLLVWKSWPGAWAAAVGLFAHPTPTPALASATGEFYLLPNPPGVSVWLDGSPLRRPPLPGMQPLRLAPGRHRLEWLPGSFPFQALSCELSVPHAGDDTCSLAPGYSLPTSLVPAGVPAGDLSVIETRASLTTLPPDQAAALTRAIQQTLDMWTSTATVAVGERYYAYAPNGSGQVRVATQPLRATLRLILREPGAPGSCALSPGAVQPCRAPGQDCSEFCTLTNPALPVSGGMGPEWPAAVVVSADWTYTTLSGQPVAQHVGDPGLNANLAVVLLAWEGSQWSVTPIFGSHASIPEADDALCDPARNWLASGPLASLLQAADRQTRPRPTIAYASGSTLTDGCVVGITAYEIGTTTAQAGPPALFLERFGVLLAANDAAHALWPTLPVADAAAISDAAALADAAAISH